MKQKSYQMKPQDILILLKIIVLENDDWKQKTLAESLSMSQSEISESLVRSDYANLIVGKKVMRMELLDFLKYGIKYTFPQKPGAIVRGIATAHSALPLSEYIDSNEDYVWPYSKGNIRGHSIIPLFPSVPEASLKDLKLYELLTLTDTLRVGKTREKNMAIEELIKRIL